MYSESLVEKIIMDLSSNVLELESAMRAEPAEVQKNIDIVIGAYQHLGTVIDIAEAKQKVALIESLLSDLLEMDSHTLYQPGVKQSDVLSSLLRVRGKEGDNK